MITGLTSGSFDLFHASHLIYLERCRSQCDKLIVGVDSDLLVAQNKGPNRPIFSQWYRHNLISSLTSLVDSCFILQNIEELTNLAFQFNVDKVFKCEKWNKGHVFGTETAELVIIKDIPGMISTTDVVAAIKEGKTSLGPIPDKYRMEDITWLEKK